MSQENLASLVDQLRGKVILKVDDGCGPLNGSDTFERMFQTSRLAMKAADEIERLRAALKVCADDLASEIDARFAGAQDHPALKVKYIRDMAPVVRARDLLEAIQN